MICESVPMEAEVDGLRYRYWLHRDLGAADKDGLVFVLLNPSTANATQDDPTIRRCMAFGKRWGYRDLTVVNLFALRATNPAALRQHGTAAIGEHNDAVLRWARNETRTHTVVAAWGNHGRHLERDAAVLRVIVPAMALRVTQLGCPAHPLYLPAEMALAPYERPRPQAAERETQRAAATPVPVRRTLAKLGADLGAARPE